MPTATNTETDNSTAVRVAFGDMQENPNHKMRNTF